MLAGEYAVLKGGHALACTVGTTLNLSYVPTSQADALSWRDQHEWTVDSDLWSETKHVSMRSGDQHKDPVCRDVSAAARYFQVLSGHVKIDSKINIQHGIGSSSAIRLGLAWCINRLHGKNAKALVSGATAHSSFDPTAEWSSETLKLAYRLQLAQQAVASGYDIVTQYVGGLTEFSFDGTGVQWKPKYFRHPVREIDRWCHIFVSDVGAPTAQTINQQLPFLEGSSARFERFYDLSENLVDALLHHHRFLSRESFRLVSSINRSHRVFFESMMDFPHEVSKQLSSLPGYDQNWTWKTTGAGGRDAILVFAPKETLPKITYALGEVGWSPPPYGFTELGLQEVSPDYGQSLSSAPSDLKGSSAGKFKVEQKDFPSIL